MRVSNSISNIDESGDICVDSMECVESWPKMRFQSGKSSSNIFLNTPWVLWESTWYFIKAVWIICLFSSFNLSTNFWISCLSNELPAIKVECIIFRKTSESFIQCHLTWWDILNSIFWAAEALKSYFVYYVSKSIKLSDVLWLNYNTCSGINNFWFTTSWE